MSDRVVVREVDVAALAPRPREAHPRGTARGDLGRAWTHRPAGAGAIDELERTDDVAQLPRPADRTVAERCQVVGVRAETDVDDGTCSLPTDSRPAAARAFAMLREPDDDRPSTQVEDHGDRFPSRPRACQTSPGGNVEL